jgi:hypothetical protein
VNGKYREDWVWSRFAAATVAAAAAAAGGVVAIGALVPTARDEILCGDSDSSCNHPRFAQVVEIPTVARNVHFYPDHAELPASYQEALHESDKLRLRRDGIWVASRSPNKLGTE